jgi:hypothetical protein
MWPQAIHDDLVATLGAKALACRTVTKYLHTAWFDPAKDPPTSDASSHHLDDSDKAILAALEEKPFSSLREFARAIHLSRVPVQRRLTNLLGFVLCHLRGAPCLLSGAQKAQWVESFSFLLRMLKVGEQRAWHDIGILDESWLNDGTDYVSGLEFKHAPDNFDRRF